jgi:methylenetetrahydrofolate dehydrogenase (NADP+)/methenyltetrahydrofolate cyclohydrolase
MSEHPPVILKAAPVVEQLRPNLKARAAAIRAQGVVPRLAIVTDNYKGPIQKYVDRKRVVGAELGIDVDLLSESRCLESLQSYLKQACNDTETNGVILQLPVAGLQGMSPRERGLREAALLDSIPLERDVDGLAHGSPFSPATPMGIFALLGHYVPDFLEQNTVLYGDGVLVGKPYGRLAKLAGAKNISVVDINTSPKERQEMLHAASIIIAATGSPESLTLADVGTDLPKIIVDAGTAERSGKNVGDMSAELRAYAENTAGWGTTPVIGGVGPLTVWNLHGNVLTAAERAMEAGTASQAWLSDTMAGQAYANMLAFEG